MPLILPKIIAPDTSHWNKLIQDAVSSDPEKSSQAKTFQNQLINSGRILLVSLHHIHEMLSTNDERLAKQRIRFLKNMGLIACLNYGYADSFPCGIPSILAAEVVAALDGANSLIEVRDRARDLMLTIQAGDTAISVDDRELRVLREQVRASVEKREMISIMANDPIDSDRTIGELISADWASPERMGHQLKDVQDNIVRKAYAHRKSESIVPEQVADLFMEHMMKTAPDFRQNVSDFFQQVLEDIGIELHEISPDMKVSDLAREIKFYPQLKAAEQAAGVSFSSMKTVNPDILPSWVIQEDYERNSQKRQKRAGSDLTDKYLLVLAAYVDEVFVDKRTFEDAQRMRRKSARFRELSCPIYKSSSYMGLLGK